MRIVLPKILAAMVVLVATDSVAHAANDDLDIAWLEGAWAAVDGSPILIVQPHRLLVREGQEDLTILPIREVRAHSVVVAPVFDDAQHVALPFSAENGSLIAKPGPSAERERFQRLDHEPKVPELRPLRLGDEKPLAPQRIEQIQYELAARAARDQEALKGSDPEVAEEIVADNLRYVQDLIQDVGWIDRKRFGVKSSWHALLMVQHGKHIPTMLAVLPHVESDFKGDRENPEVYPILLDRTRLLLGEPQLYGSQVETDETGAPVLAPLEAPQKVDQFREEQGMPKLAEYLALISQYFYDGQPVRRR